jgi:hypothetical protein
MSGTSIGLRRFGEPFQQALCFYSFPSEQRSPADIIDLVAKMNGKGGFVSFS